MKKEKKVLVIYYSYSGNTQEIAKKIAQTSQGDLLEIETVQPYPSGYNDVVKQAKEEIKAGFLPEIKTGKDNINDYDVLFIGSPSWWNTIAPPVATFLSEHDLSGKILIPFVTHEGSGIGRNGDDIARMAPDATVVAGKAFRGGSVSSAEKEVSDWVVSLLDQQK